jgi:hypothetical protein
MATALVDSGYTRPLPRFGLDERQTEDSLLNDSRFLFRVFDTRSSSILKNGFVASQYTDMPYNTGSLEEERQRLIDQAKRHSEVITKHVSTKVPTNSPVISTTLSFAWACWQANSRSELGKLGIKISVIDARRLKGFTKVALNHIKANETTTRNFANSAQEVVVFVFIPPECVLATWSWASVLSLLPVWFTQTQPDGTRTLRRCEVPGDYPYSFQERTFAFRGGFALISSGTVVQKIWESVKAALNLLGIASEHHLLCEMAFHIYTRTEPRGIGICTHELIDVLVIMAVKLGVKLGVNKGPANLTGDWCSEEDLKCVQMFCLLPIYCSSF